MSARTAYGSSQPWLTKRSLYFFVLWLPTLVPLIGIGIAVHLPFAVVHTWRARSKPTERLLVKSWFVPVKVAAWATVETTWLLVWSTLFERVVPIRSVWSLMIEKQTWTAFAFYVGTSFTVAAAYVCLGRLALCTFAARWPLDRASALNAAGEHRSP